MDRNIQQEEFSYAYIQTVAVAAGYSVVIKPRAIDFAGIDLSIEMLGENGNTLFPKFDAQVKCTAQNLNCDQNSIKFPLPIKNYKRLIHNNPLVLQLLILVLVPTDINEWIKISEEETLLKKCGYWQSLKGMPPSENRSKVTIDIPRKNLLTPSNLSKIMQKISNGEEL